MRRPSSSARPVTNATRPEPPDERREQLAERVGHVRVGGAWGDRGDRAVDVAEQRRRAGAPAAARTNASSASCPLMIGDPASTAPQASLADSVPAAVRGEAHAVAVPSSSPRVLPIPPMREMTDLPDTTSRVPAGGKPRDVRADPYLKSMLLGLIEDSYLHTGTFTQFAAEVLQVIAYAVTVPVAFTEGFLKAYLSIDRVVEDDDGRIKIIPKAGASIEDMIRDVDEITAQVDPGAVFNPVVRAKLDAVHETSSKAMKWDLNTLSRMDDGAADGGPARDAGRVGGRRRAGPERRRGHRLRARQDRHDPPQRAPVPGAAPVRRRRGATARRRRPGEVPDGAAERDGAAAPEDRI